MRKFLLLCLMAIGYCGTSFAQLTLTPEQELTMLMEGDIVAIWQKTSNKFLYGSNAQNLAYGYPEDAFVESNSGWLWLVEEAEGHLLFHLQKPAGGDYIPWSGAEGYLNSQPASGWCSFILGLNGSNSDTGEQYEYGQDLSYGALWDIEEVEGGFRLRNVGTGLYLSDAGPANKSEEDAVVWTFCTLADNSPLKSDKIKILESWIVNGNLEGDDFSSFPYSYDGPNNGSTAEDDLTIVPEGPDGSKCIKITSFPEPTESWHTQLYVKANENIPTGTKWLLKLSAKADQEDVKITSSAQGTPRQWKPGSGIPEFYVGTEWQDFTWSGTIDVADDAFQSFALDLNNGDEEVTNTAGDGTASVNREVTFWFDNFEFGLYTGACDVQYNCEAVRVLFPEYTNIPDLIAAIGKSRLMFSTDCVTVTVDGQVVPIQSVEADKKGQFMIFLHEDWLEGNELTEKNKVVVKFTNPTDEKFQVKYLDANNTVAANFEEEGTYDEYLDIESSAWAAPEVLTTDPETGSFNLPATTNTIKVTFDKKVRSKMLVAKLDGKEKLTVSPQDDAGNAEVTLTRTATEPLAAGGHTITITSVYTWTQYDIPVGTEDAPVTLTFSVGEPAMSADLAAAIAAGQTMIDNCESETDRYRGAAYNALQEAIAKYEAEGAAYTAPSQVRTAVKDLLTKTQALSAHADLCNTYDELPAKAFELYVAKKNTKFVSTDYFKNLAAAVNKYCTFAEETYFDDNTGEEITGEVLQDFVVLYEDAEMNAAKDELNDVISVAQMWLTEGKSNNNQTTGYAALHERLRRGVELLLSLGMDENSRVITEANAELGDNDDLAEAIMRHATNLIVADLASENSQLFAVVDEESEEVPSYDLSVFVKNPNTYGPAKSKEVPGWTATMGEGFAWNSWTGEKSHENALPPYPEDCSIHAGWHPNGEKGAIVEQTITNLPAGVYSIKLQIWDNGNAEDTFGFVKTSDTLDLDEGEEFDPDLYTAGFTTSSGEPITDIEVIDGQLTIGYHYGRKSQAFLEDVSIFLTAPATGYDYAAAYKQIVDGVETAKTAKVRSLAVYDLNGRRVAKSTKGINIVKKVMSDGTVKTSKVVK